MPLVSCFSKLIPEFIKSAMELSFHLSVLDSGNLNVNLPEVELEVELPGAEGTRVLAVGIAERDSELDDFELVDVFTHHQVLHAI